MPCPCSGCGASTGGDRRRTTASRSDGRFFPPVQDRGTERENHVGPRSGDSKCVIGLGNTRITQRPSESDTTRLPVRLKFPKRCRNCV